MHYLCFKLSGLTSSVTHCAGSPVPQGSHYRRKAIKGVLERVLIEIRIIWGFENISNSRVRGLTERI